MKRGFLRVSLAAISLIMVPACGGSTTSPSAPTAGALPPEGVSLASVATPSSPKHSIVPIDFTLTDSSGAPASVSIYFSDDGGVTFRPATPAFGSGSLAGLATSPSGVTHTFLWNSLDDGVAAGSVILAGITSLGTVNSQVQVQVVPAGGTATTTASFVVDNTMYRRIGSVTAPFPLDIAVIGVSETAEGDLVADAMRARYGVQMAFQNALGIREPLPAAVAPSDMTLRRPALGYATGPPYDLVFGDIARMLPFGNRVVTRTVTGAQLWAVLERGVSYYPVVNNGFPQISGFQFTFNPSNPVGSRVVSVSLEGGGAIAKDSTIYTFATNDYVNAGGDFYTMLNDGQGVAQETLLQVVADWIEAKGTISPTVAGRISVVP